MAWSPDELEQLKQERADKLRRIVALASGQISSSETHEGQRVDTTGRAITRLKEEVAEIETILAANGVPLDA